MSKSGANANALLASCRALGNATAIVPAHWQLEVGIAVITGERRGRLSPSDVLRFLSLLNGLSVVPDTQTSARSLTDTLRLARTYGLTTYDAAYLELAMRHRLTLATLDGALQKAAKAAGLALFEGAAVLSGR